MRGRLKRHAALLALLPKERRALRAQHFVLLLGLGLATLGARWDYTADDTLAALQGASARTACVIGYETGWSWSPNLYGRAGEIGAAQLHPYGRLSDFYARGYSDPWDPYQAVEYADAEIRAGRGSAWSPILLGYC